MKTERRHELKENDLAHWLTNAQARLQPFAQWGLGALILLAVLWTAFSWTRSARQAKLTNSWSEYLSVWHARDAEGLRQVAVQYPRTPAAARALYSAGQVCLFQGGPYELYTNRADAVEQLQQARDDFQAALRMPVHDEFLRPQAILGLAQAFEGLSELDEAKEQYRSLIDSYSDTTYAIVAKQRLDFLSLPDTVAFSDWFADQERPAPSSASTSEQRPRPPSVHDDIPVSDDFVLPDVNALQRGGLDPDLGPMRPPESAEVPPAPSDATPDTQDTELKEPALQTSPAAAPGSDDESSPQFE